jgi:nucleoside-diphosphate-sugar epimerase
MIYLTGSNGFVGKNLIDCLKKKNIKFYCLKRKKKIRSKNKSSYDNYPKVDLDEDNVLVHLASSSLVKLYRKKKFTNKEVLYCFANEIDTITSLVNFYKKNNFKKLIFISSSSIYGKRNFNLPFKEKDNPNPQDFYSKIKLAIEILIKKEVKNYIILRPFQIYGKYDFKKRLIPSIVFSKRDKILKLEDCLQVTDLIHVNDVCKVIINLFNKKIKNKVLNLGSGKPISLRKIVKIASKIKDNYFKYRFKKSDKKTIYNYCYADITNLKSNIDFKATKFPKSNYEIY